MVNKKSTKPLDHSGTASESSPPSAREEDPSSEDVGKDSGSLKGQGSSPSIDVERDGQRGREDMHAEESHVSCGDRPGYRVYRRLTLPQ